MFTLFQSSPNDMSIGFLAKVFGSMNGIIVPGGTSITLLGTIFKTFNSIVLVVGVMIVIYVTIMGVIATAHEGEFMGRKFHSIWVPMRIVLGITALVPTGSGYSGLQLIMMWVIIQGIGAANTVWGTTLSYIQTTGSAYTQSFIPKAPITNAMSTMFAGFVCDASARMTKKDPQDVGINYFCAANPSDPFCRTGLPDQSLKAAFSRGILTVPFGPGAGACGTATVCNPIKACAGAAADTMACAACKGQVEGLITTAPLLYKIAQIFVTDDYNYRDFIANSFNRTDRSNWAMAYEYCQANNIPQSQCCVLRKDSTGQPIPGQSCQAPNTTSPSGVFPAPYTKDDISSPPEETVKSIYFPYSIEKISKDNFVDTNTTQYMEAVTNAITTYISTVADKAVTGQFASFKSDGWIRAGAAYWEISTYGKDGKMGSALAPLTVKGPDQTKAPMKNYRNNIAATNVLMGIYYSKTGGAGADIPGAGAAMAKYNSSLGDVRSILTEKTGGSPLVSFQRSGFAMLVSAEVIFYTTVIVFVVGMIVGGTGVWGLGTGAITGGGISFLGLMLWLMPAIFGLIGYLITIGTTKGIYAPLIPFMIFSLGVVGWFISAVETMVAGPLVALGIMMPGGHHDMFGKAEPALMLMLNVFLRPSLMLIGLVTGMILASFLVGYVMDGFNFYIKSFRTGGIIALLMIELVKVGLVVLILNKCFAAIHLIPERVMRWISGSGDQYGEQGGLDTMKGEADKAGGAAKSATGDVGGRAQARGDKLRDEAKKNERDDGNASLKGKK